MLGGCCGPSLPPGWASVAVVLGKWGAVWGADDTSHVPRNGKKYLRVVYTVVSIDPAFSHSEMVDIDPITGLGTFTDLGHGASWPWRYPASPWTPQDGDIGIRDSSLYNPYSSCQHGFPFNGRPGGGTGPTVNGLTLEYRDGGGAVFKTITFSNENTDYMVESRCDSLLFNALCSIRYPRNLFCQEMIGDFNASASFMGHNKDYPFGGSFCSDSNQGCQSSGPSAGTIVDKDGTSICLFTKRKSLVVFQAGATCLKTTQGLDGNSVITYSAAPACTGAGCRLDPPLAVPGFEYPIGHNVNLREYINQSCPV